MSERIQVAYWRNGLGEECSSKIMAEFEANDQVYIVVRNWRKSPPYDNDGGMDIIPRLMCDVIRWETPR